jgi:hypothetical protein
VAGVAGPQAGLGQRPLAPTNRRQLGRASRQRELAAAHARIGLPGPVLHSIVLYWFGLLRCLALPCLARPGERLNPSVELSISQCHSRCQRNRDNRETAHDRLGSVRRGKTRAQRAKRRAQSRAHARNVTSTWDSVHGSGAGQSYAPAAPLSAALPLSSSPAARRPPPARHSWLMAWLVWSLADASWGANNCFSAQLFLEPGVQVTRLTPGAKCHRPPPTVLPIAHTCPAIRPVPTLSTNMSMAVASAVAVAVSIPHPSIRCLVGPQP